MIHVHLTEAGKAAYLEEHKGIEVILNRLIDKIGIDRALSVAHDLSDIIEALDSIVPDPAKPGMMPAASPTK